MAWQPHRGVNPHRHHRCGVGVYAGVVHACGAHVLLQQAGHDLMIGPAMLDRRAQLGLCMHALHACIHAPKCTEHPPPSPSLEPWAWPCVIVMCHATSRSTCAQQQRSPRGPGGGAMTQQQQGVSTHGKKLGRTPPPETLVVLLSVFFGTGIQEGGFQARESLALHPRAAREREHHGHPPCVQPALCWRCCAAWSTACHAQHRCLPLLR